MNFVYANAETYSLNPWSSSVWTETAHSAEVSNSSPADAWTWPQTILDVKNESNTRSINENDTTVAGASRTPSSGRQSSSPSSLSQSSPPADQLDDFLFGSNFGLAVPETPMYSNAFAKRPLTNRANRETTETVAVDSSACVAQIVGKNGCKIKLLRAKYDVYIHTPVAGEEPVFIIKGRREDVNRIKQEILDTAQHFNQLRVSKMAKIASIVNAEGSVCIHLHLPERFVGLVVGRNGWYVKVLQARFNIHIETPKFDVRTYFLIYGAEENVQKSLEAIVEHISSKNNNLQLSCRRTGLECFIE